jgi:serine/threonine protein kinase
MEKILKQISWKGPLFYVVIQKNNKDGKYVYTDVNNIYILKLEDMNKNNDGSDNEKKVLQMLLTNPLDNLPRPIKFSKTVENINVSVMENSGISLDGKTFYNKFKTIPTTLQFLSAVKSLVNGVHNLHSMGFIHRDITPGNLVFDVKKNNWTLIDFDFTVPFDYPEMGSEVIVNKKYDYIIHPWFKLRQENDEMYFDVPRLQNYMKGTNIHWYMLIDYYATAKVLLYTFNLILSNDITCVHLVNDSAGLTSILKGNLVSSNPIAKKILSILYSIVGSFEDGNNLPIATDSWNLLLTLVGIKTNRKKRSRNEVENIVGNLGKISKIKNSTGTHTYTLIK